MSLVLATQTKLSWAWCGAVLGGGKVPKSCQCPESCGTVSGLIAGVKIL